MCANTGPKVYCDAGWIVGYKEGVRIAVPAVEAGKEVRREDIAALLAKRGYGPERYPDRSVADARVAEAMDLAGRGLLFAVQGFNRLHLGHFNRLSPAEFTYHTQLNLPEEVSRLFGRWTEGGFVELGAQVANSLIDRSSAVREGSAVDSCILLSTVVDGAKISEIGYSEGRVRYTRSGEERAIVYDPERYYASVF